MSPDLRRQPGPHVFVDNLDAPTLSEDDLHHLTRSLRLLDGDPFTMSDGQHRWRSASFGSVPTDLGPIVERQVPVKDCTVAFALTKSAKPELVAQKATEIGIDRLIVFHGDHSVPRWTESKQASALTRLTRVAREAAMQSRQVRLPTIEIVDDLAAVVAAIGAHLCSGALARADFGGDPIDGEVRHIVIGPEGGWSSQERTLVPTAVDLGPSVLRAETAAIVAAHELISRRHLEMGR